MSNPMCHRVWCHEHGFCDRLRRIATCTDELARIRSTFGKNHPQAMIIEVGELDQLEELHRLIWEEE
jgi:hypothetical protein